MKKGATANNGKGIAGVASGVKIMPVSICYTDDEKELGITPSTTTNSGSAPATPVVKSALSEVDPGDLSMMGLGYDKWNIAYLARDRGAQNLNLILRILNFMTSSVRHRKTDSVLLLAYISP